MDFIDWRKSSQKITLNTEEEHAPRPRRYQGKAFSDYIDEQIRSAQERGEFDNLQGAGKPLNLDENIFAGDKALGYNLLKNNGLAPAEVELAKEIREERARAEKKLERVIHLSKTLRRRRIPPSASERKAFTSKARKAGEEYERTLRELNRKILTLNLIVPTIMQQEPIHVEEAVKQFHDNCPLFGETW